MRDLLITMIVVVGCVYTLKRSYIGVLLWSWLSYMNPHRLAYGFAFSMPFAQITAIVLFISMVYSKDKQRIPINSITSLWLLYIIYMGVTTLFAFYGDAAYSQYVKVLKIQLIIFLTMILINDMDKLRHLIWVIVLSIGFYSVKGGIFTLMSGGSYKVWGPDGSFIEDNNHLAVAVLMTIPLMLFLRQTTDIKWMKHGLSFAIVTSSFTVLGSQSRGAMLAIVVVALFYWIKSKANKIISGFIIVLFGVILFMFMPDSWHERMGTIGEYEQDGSAMGRINAWEYAFNSANHNILGMGFDSWSPETFAIYAPVPEDVHAAHSIYFSVLADHGWIGLLLFLMIIFVTWWRLSIMIKYSKDQYRLKDIDLLCRMLQVGLIAYLVGGAFLSLAYFDLPWHLISFVVLLTTFVDRDKLEEIKNSNQINKIKYG